MKITRIDPWRFKLGEGPLWDVAEQALYGTDVLGRQIWRYDPARGDFNSWSFSKQVSALALCRSGGAIIAVTTGLFHFDFATGAQTLICELCSQTNQLQLNDGKTDRSGRFLIGSVHTGGVANAELYSIDNHHTVTTLDRGYSVTNGPCWSPDSQTFYCADSVRGDIYAYDYELRSGAVAARRVFANTLRLGGIPDGATVDASGNLWTAICGGGKVVAFTPDGTIARVIDLPTPLVSSVMFGGPGLDRLFVTSIDGAAAAKEIPMAAANPVPSDENSGALFVIDGLGVSGLPESRFGC
jgi:sugar lactone lactonase YvrE